MSDKPSGRGRRTRMWIRSTHKAQLVSSWAIETITVCKKSDTEYGLYAQGHDNAWWLFVGTEQNCNEAFNALAKLLTAEDAQ
jgi:hypothetical protein